MGGIEADGLLECLKGLDVVLLPPKVPPHQITAVGLQVGGLRARANRVLPGREPRLHRLDDSRGNLVLDGEYVRGLPVESLRPELVASRGVGHLGGDAQPASCRAHAAFQDVANRQRARDRREVAGLASRPERRGAGGDANPLDPDERVHDLLGHALAEVLLVLRRTHVRERKHRDRDLRRRRRRRRRLGRCGKAEPRLAQAVHQAFDEIGVPPLLKLRARFSGEGRPQREQLAKGSSGRFTLS
jgi:hypothetical protein